MEESRYNSPDAFVMAELKDAHTQLEHLKNQVSDLLAKLNQRDAEIAQLLNEKADFIELVQPLITRFGPEENHVTLCLVNTSYEKYLNNGENYARAMSFLELVEPSAAEYIESHKEEANG